MAKTPNVALLIEPTTSYGREILRGIARFARTRGNWVFHFEHAATTDVMIGNIREMEDLDGVIFRYGTDAQLQAIRDLGVPAVRVGSGQPDISFPDVQTNNRAVGKMACDYLAERGYQRMATVTFVDRAYSAERTRAFIDSVQEQNLQVNELEMSDRQWDYTRVPQRSGLLVPWLKELEPPLGMFASNDEVGRHLADACRMADLRVPEDVGLLSVDNDEVLCELANPPLSSIELGAERIGYAAARLMARLLRSKKEDAPAPVLVDPVAVVTRRSSDPYGVAAGLVNEALRYIWEHASEGISVDDLVQTLDVSRRWLEVRFRRAIQCSPAARIRQVQVEKAKKLLAETDLLIPDVAEAAGFGDAKLLIAVFRRLVGMQPTAYRRRYSLR